LRVTSDFWVSAYVRRRFGAGGFAAVVRRGAREAGAIFVKINRLDGTADLYGPAPQAEIGEAGGDRMFEPLLTGVPEAEIAARLAREQRFDPDIWVVEAEDREGRAELDLPSRPG